MGRLVGSVMRGQDEEWRASRHLSEEKMPKLHVEQATRPTKTPPTTERASELRFVARKATYAGLELADELEVEQDEAEMKGPQVTCRTPRKRALAPTLPTLPSEASLFKEVFSEDRQRRGG